jgi:hypothetical protein
MSEPNSPFAPTPASIDEMSQGFSTDPTQCAIWKLQQFRPRVWLAVSHWSGQPPSNLRSTTPLGSLTPAWNIAAQNQLVAATNQQQVFAPYPSIMVPPNRLLDPNTTIAQWEAIVWSLQTPKTPCWGTA